MRLERLQPGHRVPQPRLHLVGFRREELEGNADLVADVGTAREAELRHQAVSLAIGWQGGIGDQQAAVAAEPQLHRQRRIGAGARLELLGFLEVEPGLGEPFGDLPVGEAEPHMRMLVAQELQPVRGEIDDQQPAGRPQQCAPPRGSPSAGSSR